MSPYEIAFQPSVEKDLPKLSAEICDRSIVYLFQHSAKLDSGNIAQHQKRSVFRN
mgnify:CR=1 FL=1